MTQDSVAKENSSRSKIPDSGNRTEFLEGGGARDIQPCNGRCDLMPLDVIAELIAGAEFIKKDALINIFNLSEYQAMHKILCLIDNYIYKGNVNALFESVIVFVFQNYATRSINESNFERVVSETLSTGVLDLSHRYREGAEKYAERNWEKGIPTKSFLDSAVRHLLKWYRQDAEENHASAFMWNIVGAIWTHIHKPECIGEMPFMLVEPDKE